MSDKKSRTKFDRRNFLKIAGAAGLATGAGAMLPKDLMLASAEKSGKGKMTHDVKPGKLDDYYGFWSGGHSGEIRIIGVPSMREIHRIPVFNRECGSGWGITNESKKLLRGRDCGDTHHVHGSYVDGIYDGKYLFVNDKLNNRVARIRIDYMEVDAILDVPNIQGAHGLFPQRYPKTDWLVVNSEFQTPVPNDASNSKAFHNPQEYYGMHTIIDGQGQIDRRFTGFLLFAPNRFGDATDQQGIKRTDGVHSVIFGTADRNNDNVILATVFNDFLSDGILDVGTRFIHFARGGNLTCLQEFFDFRIGHVVDSLFELSDRRILK
jgi:hypothetical protein